MRPVTDPPADLLAEARALVEDREPHAQFRRALWAGGLIAVNIIGWTLFLLWLHPN